MAVATRIHATPSVQLLLLGCTLPLCLSVILASEESLDVKDAVKRAARQKRDPSNPGYGSLTWIYPGMAAALDILDIGFNGSHSNSMPENPLSLSKRIGLTGVTRLISKISEQERQRSLDEVRSVYCERLAACNVGRDLLTEIGQQEAQDTIDKDMKYLQSALLGIWGYDCDMMYRGCTDFH